MRYMVYIVIRTVTKICQTDIKSLITRSDVTCLQTARTTRTMTKSVWRRSISGWRYISSETDKLYTRPGFFIFIRVEIKYTRLTSSTLGKRNLYQSKRVTDSDVKKAYTIHHQTDIQEYIRPDIMYHWLPTIIKLRPGVIPSTPLYTISPLFI